jgi:hypothetical protein
MTSRTRKLRHYRFGTGKLPLRHMRRGVRLRREFIGGKTRWSLSDGSKISPFVVRQILATQQVVSANDGLFADAAQTFIVCGDDSR